MRIETGNYVNLYVIKISENELTSYMNPYKDKA